MFCVIFLVSGCMLCLVQYLFVISTSNCNCLTVTDALVLCPLLEDRGRLQSQSVSWSHTESNSTIDCQVRFVSEINTLFRKNSAQYTMHNKHNTPLH